MRALAAVLARSTRHGQGSLNFALGACRRYERESARSCACEEYPSRAEVTKFCPSCLQSSGSSTYFARIRDGCWTHSPTAINSPNAMCIQILDQVPETRYLEFQLTWCCINQVSIMDEVVMVGDHLESNSCKAVDWIEGIINRLCACFFVCIQLKLVFLNNARPCDNSYPSFRLPSCNY